jgi:hypothetical protein
MQAPELEKFVPAMFWKALYGKPFSGWVWGKEIGIFYKDGQLWKILPMTTGRLFVWI